MIKGRDLNAVDKLTVKHPEFPIELIKTGSNDDLHHWARKHKLTAHFAVIERSELDKKVIKGAIPQNAFILAAYKGSGTSKKIRLFGLRCGSHEAN
jgi:hypothetical protein